LFHTPPDSPFNIIRGAGSRRRLLGALGAGSGAALFAACGGAGGAGGAPPSGAITDRGSTAGSARGLLVQPVIPGTDTAVGRNRFALAILQVGKDGALPKPLPDAELQLRFFHPIEPQPVAKGEAKPEFRYVGDKTKGLYIAQVQFDQPGAWGVEVSGTAGGQALATARVQFQVKPRAETPAIGAPAPRTRNLTRHDVDDIKKIDSGATPNDMHEVSIAQALDLKKPLVALFASPGFCVTQTCAPQLGEVQKLKAKYGDRASFVHVEIFKDPNTRAVYEAVTEWGLTSEPWTFLVDRDGKIAEKYEGPAPAEEMDAALAKLV
jgi:hypothetical protein